MNSGNVIHTSIEAEGVGDILEEFREDMAGGPPRWFQIENTLVFTGAVSAIEAD